MCGELSEVSQEERGSSIMGLGEKGRGGGGGGVGKGAG